MFSPLASRAKQRSQFCSDDTWKRRQLFFFFSQLFLSVWRLLNSITAGTMMKEQLLVWNASQAGSYTLRTKSISAALVCRGVCVIYIMLWIHWGKKALEHGSTVVKFLSFFPDIFVWPLQQYKLDLTITLWKLGKEIRKGDWGKSIKRWRYSE